jgi:hypothetical protein
MYLYPGHVAAVLEAAFPASLSATVSRAAALIPTAADEASDSFEVWVDDREVRIPNRIYSSELPRDALDALDRDLRDVLACLYTRHHDGHVRQRHLRWIIQRTDPWVPPFVVRLIGEYVIEILHDIREGLGELEIEGSPQQRQYGLFAALNPAFIDVTRRRVVSYWNCYYRQRYPDRAEYPGSVLISSLTRAAANQPLG